MIPSGFMLIAVSNSLAINVGRVPAERFGGFDRALGHVRAEGRYSGARDGDYFLVLWCFDRCFRTDPTSDGFKIINRQFKLGGLGLSACHQAARRFAYKLFGLCY